MSSMIIRHRLGDWDDLFMSIAVRVSAMSKDPERKVGAVLVSADKRHLSTGYNGFPEDVPDSVDALADKDYKLAHMVHAEVNCLSQASFITFRGTLYVTTFPCAECAAAIVEYGSKYDSRISRLVAPRPDMSHSKWASSWAAAEASLREAGIDVAAFLGVMK